MSRAGIRAVTVAPTSAQQVLYTAYPQLQSVWEEYQAGGGETAAADTVHDLFSQMMDNPALRQAAEAEARRYFFENYTPHLVVGGVALVGLLVASYQAGKSTGGR